jgi:hypothetical protein
VSTAGGEEHAHRRRGKAQIDGEETGALAGRIRGRRRVRSRVTRSLEEEQGRRSCRRRSRGLAAGEVRAARSPSGLLGDALTGRTWENTLSGGGAGAACSSAEELGRRAHRGRRWGDELTAGEVFQLSVGRELESKTKKKCLRGQR